jgi:hypothetical protein
MASGQRETTAARPIPVVLGVGLASANAVDARVSFVLRLEEWYTEFEAEY